MGAMANEADQTRCQAELEAFRFGHFKLGTDADRFLPKVINGGGGGSRPSMMHHQPSMTVAQLSPSLRGQPVSAQPPVDARKMKTSCMLGGGGTRQKTGAICLAYIGITVQKCG